MSPEIEAIFLDVGNTLRIVEKDEAFSLSAMQELVRVIGADEPPVEFCKKLEVRFKAYRRQAKETLLDVPERVLWTEYMLPDFPAEKIAPLSGKLTRLWRDRDGRRVARPDVKEVVPELCRRGYTLGIIANTITETEIPDWLEQDGLGGYFKAVVLSSLVRIRKPNPEIYLEACRRAGVEPAKSVYVGDNPSRDILGARLAGYAQALIIVEPDTLAKEPPTGNNVPDHYITECSDLLNLFPPRRK
ncbi:MAG: HAD family hydrolase [Anaerolineaceae bacterium]